FLCKKYHKKLALDYKRLLLDQLCAYVRAIDGSVKEGSLTEPLALLQGLQKSSEYIMQGIRRSISKNRQPDFLLIA
ncbi:hypothetical protein L211DRAFT_793048, partial [Terfezia boudieri ATCC MYA-4762]